MVFFLSVWVLLTPDRILTFPRWISHIIKTISYSGELKTSWGMSVWRKKMLCNLVVKVRHENNVCLCSTIVIFRPVMKVDQSSLLRRDFLFEAVSLWPHWFLTSTTGQKNAVSEVVGLHVSAALGMKSGDVLSTVRVRQRSWGFCKLDLIQKCCGIVFFNPLRIKTVFVKDKTDNDCRPTVEHKSQLEHNKKEWDPFVSLDFSRDSDF